MLEAVHANHLQAPAVLEAIYANHLCEMSSLSSPVGDVSQRQPRHSAAAVAIDRSSLTPKRTSPGSAQYIPSRQQRRNGPGLHLRQVRVSHISNGLRVTAGSASAAKF